MPITPVSSLFTIKASHLFLLLMQLLLIINAQNCSSSDYTAGQSAYLCTVCFTDSTWTGCSKTDCNYDWDTLNCRGGQITNLTNADCLKQCCPGGVLDSFTESTWQKCKILFTEDAKRSTNGKIIGVIVISIFGVIILGLAIWIFIRYRKKKEDAHPSETEISQPVLNQKQYLEQLLERPNQVDNQPEIELPNISVSGN